MSSNRIIVIGASAGGVEALKELARRLPPDFNAPILVVLHVSPDRRSMMPAILRRAGVLPALHAESGEKLLPGRIYVAPPDHHLLVKHGFMTLSRGPRENGHRPAVDPLFRTAAQQYGKQVIGVILSGSLDDGTAGLAVIKEKGGIAVVQSPDDALNAGMPTSAIENVQVDYVLPVAEIATLLIRLLHEEVKSDPSDSDKALDYETDIAEFDMNAIQNEQPPGQLSTFICPECGGALWEITEGAILRYRCHVGHAYSADTLLSHQTAELEGALWTALRALEDHAAMNRRIAERSLSRNRSRAAAQYEKQAQNLEVQVKLIRDVLLKGLVQDKTSLTYDQQENAENAEFQDSGGDV